jgi:hypothetical protein
VLVDLCIGGSALLEDLLRSWLLAFSEHLGEYATPSRNRNSESERAISQSRPRWLPRKKFEDLIDLNRIQKGCSAGDEWWPSKNQARGASPPASYVLLRPRTHRRSRELSLTRLSIARWGSSQLGDAVQLMPNTTLRI